VSVDSVASDVQEREQSQYYYYHTNYCTRLNNVALVKTNATRRVLTFVLTSRCPAPAGVAIYGTCRANRAIRGFVAGIFDESYPSMYLVSALNRMSLIRDLVCVREAEVTPCLEVVACMRITPQLLTKVRSMAQG
jgi:hypothetical protein